MTDSQEKSKRSFWVRRMSKVLGVSVLCIVGFILSGASHMTEFGILADYINYSEYVPTNPVPVEGSSAKSHYAKWEIINNKLPLDIHTGETHFTILDVGIEDVKDIGPTIWFKLDVDDVGTAPENSPSSQFDMDVNITQSNGLSAMRLSRSDEAAERLDEQLHMNAHQSPGKDAVVKEALVAYKLEFYPGDIYLTMPWDIGRDGGYVFVNK